MLALVCTHLNNKDKFYVYVFRGKDFKEFNHETHEKARKSHEKNAKVSVYGA